MADFKTLDDLPADLTGKVALVRVDLNLPMKDGSATDVTRVEAAKPTILELTEKGAKVFKKCQACHKVEPGVNATGPSLYGVVGRQVASEAGFGYSDAMKAHGGDWTPEALNEFLHKPSAAAPGTAMSFAGLPKIGDRADVIAYLDSLDN